MEFIPVSVQCYSGYKTEEVPQRIILPEYSLQIIEVIDRWYEGALESTRPIVDYFKVKTIDGAVYLLCYERDYDQWSAAQLTFHSE